MARHTSSSPNYTAHHSSRGFINPWSLPPLLHATGIPILWRAGHIHHRHPLQNILPITHPGDQHGRSLTSNVTRTPMKLKNEFSFGPPQGARLLLYLFGTTAYLGVTQIVTF